MPIRKGQLAKLADLIRSRKAAGSPSFVLVLGADTSAVMSGVLTSLTGETNKLAVYDASVARMGPDDQLAAVSAELARLQRPEFYAFVAGLVLDGYLRRIVTSTVDPYLEESFLSVGLSRSNFRIVVVGADRDELISKEINRTDDIALVLALRGSKDRGSLLLKRSLFLEDKLKSAVENLLERDLIICGYNPIFDDSLIGMYVNGTSERAVWFVGEKQPDPTRHNLIYSRLAECKTSYVISKLYEFGKQLHETLVSLPAPSASPHVESYRESVITGLTGEWFDRFINLYIIPIKLQMEAIRRTEETYTILEVAERFQATPIALIGEPGSGKTTLLKKLAIGYARSQRLPVFIPMLNYDGKRNLIDLIVEALRPLRRSDTEIRELFGRGQLLVLMDGLNEVGQQSDQNVLDRAAKEIQNFVSQYPLNQYFLSCRTAEFPNHLREPFQRMEVLPADPRAVKDYFGSALGPGIGQTLFAHLGPKVRSLCRNPLLLTMLVYIFERQDQPQTDQIQDLGAIPSTKAQVYEQFVELLMERETQLRNIHTPVSTRQRVLRQLAFSMANQVLRIKRETAESFVELLYNPNLGVTIKDFLHEVLDLPPLKASEPGQFADISFMHQSFQEFYAALELRDQLSKKSITIESIADYAEDETKRWWETLVLLAGLLTDATALVRAIKEHNLYLASRCIESSKSIDASEVDDVIIQVVDAWKYGGEFNYDLLYCMQAIADRRSPYLPSRIMENIEYLLRKYVRESPTELSDINEDTLLAYLDAEDEDLQVDAIWTLGQQRNKNAAPRLIRKLEDASAKIKEQIVISLGRISDVSAIQPLVAIMQNIYEPDWLRAYAANALGAIGSPEAIPALIAYMDDLTAPYRDSAAWAIERIKDPRAKEILVQALFRESDQYTLGTTLYALGELGATDATNTIITWLQRITNPYVIEDAVYALGKLGGEPSIRELIRQLSNVDAIVRMRAANSLALVGDESSLEPLTALIMDGAEFVRRSAATALNSVRSACQANTRVG